MTTKTRTAHASETADLLAALSIATARMPRVRWARPEESEIRGTLLATYEHSYFGTVAVVKWDTEDCPHGFVEMKDIAPGSM